MSGMFIPPVPVTVKDRVTALLNALEFGLYPPDGCKACKAAMADRCDEHAQDLAAMNAVMNAIPLVQEAADDFEAAKVFMGLMAKLSGVTRYGVACGTAPVMVPVLTGVAR